MNNMKNIFSLKTLWSALYFLAGIALMGGIWELISNLTKNEIPSPRNTWIVFKEVIQNPMQDDPDYKGIGVKAVELIKTGWHWFRLWQPGCHSNRYADGFEIK
jgi:nitrate/nitrite transport system permease protein